MSTTCTGCDYPASIRDDNGRGLTCGCAALYSPADRVPGTAYTRLHGAPPTMTRPGRPVPTLATACAALASALSQPRPPWCGEATWTAAQALVAAARADLLAATGSKVPSKSEPAEALRARLGAGRATVADWLRRSGWLFPKTNTPKARP